uniref:Uncharacterized protein n=1 Tax=Anguilla anguilla TaxID=7936 RepID=A0A0E9VQP3_ANGAN
MLSGRTVRVSVEALPPLQSNLTALRAFILFC